MTSPLTSISPSVRPGVSEKNLCARQQSPTFVRSKEIGTADRAPIVPADPQQSLGHLVRTLYSGCEALGMAPGELRGLTVANRAMMLYRTRTGDAYVLQTPEDARASIRNGFHINNEFQLMLDQERITSTHPRYSEAIAQATNLIMAIR